MSKIKTASEPKLLPTQHLLFLIDLEDNKVDYLNKVAERFCGIDENFIKKNKLTFYKEFVHPEDYEGYMQHLENNVNEEEKSYSLRLKDRNQNWKIFTFTDRLYLPRDGQQQKILSLASPKIGPDQGNKDDSSHASLKTEYEHLLNSLHDGFSIVEMIYDKDGVPFDYFYVKTNPAFQEHVNFQDVTGKTVRELVTKPNEKWLKAFAKVAETGESIRFKEYNSNLGDTWLDLYAFKVGEKDDRRIGILFRNITDEKKQEEDLQNRLERHHKDLQESRDLLQNVFDTTNLGIAVLKAIYEGGEIKNFVFLRTNKVLQEMYLQEEIIGRTYLETTKHGVDMGIFDAYKEVMTTGEPLDLEVYFDKEGYNHWFRVTARSQDNLLIATIEDITQRKEEARELEETMRFKQELVRATPEVIMIINLNSFTIRYMNKDLFAEAGLTKDKVVGMNLQQVLPYIHPRDREKLMQFHRNLLISSVKDVIEEEIRLKIKGTTWEWFNLRGKVFKRRDAAWVDEYVLLIRNIHEQKNTQKALLKAEKLSIQGEIARTFAHELRNPLASIGMVGEVLSRKLKDSVNDGYSNYFKILKRSTKTLNDLVNNLLNASNYSPSVLKEEDLAELMDNCIGKAADRIYLSGIKVEKKYEGKFPVLADKEKLEIALLNLLVNSSEATTPGEGKIEIEIKSHKTDFMLRISDNGQGMTQDQIDNIFEAFYSNKETGMGIGMSSVKNILEEHDAPIKVSSKLKEGTTFKIYFPNAKLD